MPDSNPTSGRTLYLIAAVLAALGLALGLWDLLVERDEGGNALLGAFLPAAVLVLMLVLYFRSGRS